jgi:WD40 repeat protein
MWDFEQCSLLSNKLLSTGQRDGKIKRITTSSQHAVCATKTGTLLVLGLDDLQDQPERCRITKHRLGRIIFSGDERRVLVPCSDRLSYVYDISRNIVVQRLTGHGDSVTGAIFGLDDRFCVTTSYDKSCILWDLRVAKQIVTRLSLPFPGLSVGVCDNGLLIVTGMSHDVHVYDLGLTTPIWVCKGHKAWPNQVCTTDGHKVYTSADYDSIGEINTMTGKMKILCSVELETVYEMKFSRNLNTLRIVGLPHEDDVR